MTTIPSTPHNLFLLPTQEQIKATTSPAISGTPRTFVIRSRNPRDQIMQIQREKGDQSLSSSSSRSMDESELRKVFQMFDKNGDGQITKKELGESLKNLGIYIPEEELDATMDRIDANGDGCVDVEEFGLLYRSILGEGGGNKGAGGDQEDGMREAFDVFDQNGDGYITVEELRSVLASLGLKQGRTVEECRQMISKVDADGDGRVDFKEFKQMMRGGGFAAIGGSG